ncbi:MULTISPECIES: cell division protein ZipA [Gammaproteobacteria]|uniref:cell division protein ZipA n=1 Tax=Gammaproteobacteria TaxID=1236 RepID=UPI001ADD3339|nr:MULTISPECIES: cell division protein ZipA [Gammaproteobacteria]MBO9481152.1 cell division protein ZipA [Salinisphaera sp. G21_0]MBO9494443.1 cell division protein ZipA [Thalassotalea sp. G20_0]
MSLRDWLILIGILVIIGVLADGYRRMRLARKRSSEISFGLEEVKGYDDDFSSELPNGGARPSAHKESTLKESFLKEGFTKKESARPRVEPGFSGGDYFDDYPEEGIEEPPVYPESLRQRHRHPEEAERHAEQSDAGEKARVQRALDLDEPVPVLMNLDESQQPSRSKRLSSSEDHLQSGGFSRAAGADRSVRSRETSRLDAGPEEFVGQPRAATSQGKAPIQERDVSARESSNPQKELNLGGREKAEKLQERPPASEVIVINVLAKGGGVFAGDQLMQSMLASGMRFGDMSIFHRYTNADDTGKILFSMANGVKPGTFTIDNLEATETPALSLFMSLPGPEKPMQAFALMEETARRLALDLGGELKDEQFSVMTQQTLEHCRQRIREYERKQLAKQPVH